MSKLSDFMGSLTNEQKDYLIKRGEIPGNTTEERIRNASRILVDAFNNGEISPLTKSQRLNLSKYATATPTVYSADAVLSSLGGSEAMTDSLGKKRDPREVLVETYDAMDPTERGMHKEIFEANNGKDSWKNVKKVVENSRKDLEELKTPKKEVGTAAKVLGTIFAPRSLEAWEQGRDASLKDMALDFGENALMALPLAGWAGAGVKGARVGKAGRVLATSIANALVPHISEAADAVAYSPEENLDRSVYSEADAGIGTATNIGAPYVLGQTAGRIGRMLGEKFGGTEGLSDKTRKVLDDLVIDGKWKKPSKEAVAAVKGRDDVAKYVKEMDALTNGEWSRDLSEGVKDIPPVEKKLRNEIFDRTLYSKEKPTPGQVIEAGLVQKRADDFGISPRELVTNPDNLVITGEGTGATKYSDILSDISLLKGDLEKANFLDKVHYTNPKADYALQGLESWGVNKYGSNKDANAVLSAVSSLTGGNFDAKNFFESSKKKAVAEAKSEQQKRMASRVFDSLDKEDWSDEDRKYMELVKEKPGLLKGIGSEARDPKFRNWLMLRGTDILRGTDLYRPTPLVQ